MGKNNNNKNYIIGAASVGDLCVLLILTSLLATSSPHTGSHHLFWHSHSTISLAYTIRPSFFQEYPKIPVREIAWKISEPKSRDWALSSLPQLTLSFLGLCGFRACGLEGFFCCLPAPGSRLFALFTTLGSGVLGLVIYFHLDPVSGLRLCGLGIVRFQDCVEPWARTLARSRRREFKVSRVWDCTLHVLLKSTLP